MEFKNKIKAKKHWKEYPSKEFGTKRQEGNATKKSLIGCNATEISCFMLRTAVLFKQLQSTALDGTSSKRLIASVPSSASTLCCWQHPLYTKCQQLPSAANLKGDTWL